ncbi:MAG: phosphate ABC transporter permease PstA [Dehalococcoidia bacterium]|nr:phosphate ABC transporter permease PstA [Dehalococcoidia bacterium]
MALDSNAVTTLRATGAVARRQFVSRASRWVFLVATMLGVTALLFLAYDTAQSGGTHVDLDFLTSYPSRFAEQAGLRSAILGTLWVMVVTVALAIPVAIGTALYITEFAPKGKLLTLIELNLSNLAGVPSIIYGILGLAVFVRLMDLGPSILAGALTLAIMILPMTVIASVEAIRQVPPSIRDGSLALGATRWQTVWYHTLPGAMPGIMTGTILAISRAAGETAALIMIGAFSFIAFDPAGVTDDFTTVPIQIYNWTIRPGEDFKEIAAAAIIVMMVFILSLNLVAIAIRERFRR